MTYFNSTFWGGFHPVGLNNEPDQHQALIQYSASQHLVTVLTSTDHPVNKRFKLQDGKVGAIQYQNARLFNTEVFPVSNIHEFAKLIEENSANQFKIIVRGIHPKLNANQVQRTLEQFPEHPDGTQWVMLDFDDVDVGDLDPLSMDAIVYIISKLPVEFHEASYYFQFSSSSGILNPDGTLRKTGLNVHLFFWLNRRVPGKQLTAYLQKHCLDTGFYSLGEKKGGVVELHILGHREHPFWVNVNGDSD